jgi:hypothetical protein
MTAHGRSKFNRTLAACAAAAALAAPAAQASPNIEPGSGSAGPASNPIEFDEPTVTTTVDEGFDWGSAAIGAGGASALLLLSLGGAAQVARARAHGHAA